VLANFGFFFDHLFFLLRDRHFVQIRFSRSSPHVLLFSFFNDLVGCISLNFIPLCELLGKIPELGILFQILLLLLLLLLLLYFSELFDLVKVDVRLMF